MSIVCADCTVLTTAASEQMLPKNIALLNMVKSTIQSTGRRKHNKFEKSEVESKLSDELEDIDGKQLKTEASVIRDKTKNQKDFDRFLDMIDADAISNIDKAD